MPGVTGVPEVLRKQALAPAVRLFADEVYNQFKCLSLFRGAGETVYSEEEFVWEIAEYIRNLATFHAQPAQAEQTADTRAGKFSGRPLYLAESFTLNSNDLALWKEFGESSDLPLTLQDLLAKGQRMVNTRLQQKMWKFMRTFEDLACKILSESSVSLTVDGSSETIDYGVTLQPLSVDWSLPATDIVDDFQRKLDQFVLAAGGLPTDIVTNFQFWSSYVTGNDDFREFDVRNAMMNSMDLFLNATNLGSSDVRPRWHNISDREELTPPPAATYRDLYPINRMAFIRNDPGVLELATTRTYDNDLNGGAFAHEVMHETAPRSLEIFVTDNKLPVVRNNQKVMLFTMEP